MKKKQLLRIILLTILMPIFTNYNSKGIAQVDIYNEVNSMNNAMREQLGQEKTVLPRPGDFNLDRPTTTGPSTGANLGAGQGSAVEIATGATEAATSAVNNNPTYTKGNDPHSTGTPAERPILPEPKPLSIASEITSSEYSSLAEEYIQNPESFSWKKKYEDLCKEKGIKIGSKSDFLDFKENLKKYILDKITNIRSLYAFCEFTDITELESGKYDLGGAPAGWKRFYVNQKVSKWLRDKYHFELRIFQSTWDPQVFVMSFRTIGDKIHTATSNHSSDLAPEKKMSIQQILEKLTPEQREIYIRLKKELDDRYEYEIFKADDMAKMALEMKQDDAKFAGAFMAIKAIVYREQVKRRYNEEVQKLDDAARKGVENQRMKIEKARVNIAQKVNQKKLENIFNEIGESLSTYSPSGTKRMYLSYPGRPQNFSEGGAPIPNQYAERLIQEYEKNMSSDEKKERKPYSPHLSPSLEDLPLGQRYGCSDLFTFRQYIDKVEESLKKK